MLLYRVLLCLKLLVLTVIGISAGNVVSVTFDGSDYELHFGSAGKWIARANFTDNTFADGWGYLEVETNPVFADTLQAYAAGMVEGFSSADMIYKAYRNTLEGFCEWKSEAFCDRLRNYLAKNMRWMKSMIALKTDSCPVWHNVELTLAQVNGVAAGYNKSEQPPIGEEAIMWMNLFGDLEDLETALDPNVHNMSIDDWINSGHTLQDGHCSALIKVLPGNVDLYVSHVTWNTYQSMLRIQKKYKFPFRRTGSSDPDDLIPGHTVAFSSYPGILMSGDDFHVLSTGLVTLETTIGNSNPALWKNATDPEEILEWIRTIVANRLAEDGQSWTKFFSMHNSGTYNNQWMVVDYKLFKPGKRIKANTLWILEQIPGFIVAGDQSQILQSQSYWPSYNVPFYKSVFNLSGLPAMVEKYGDWFSYDKTPRALIFQRDHSSVKNINTMIRMMRYNDFKHDPLSRCNCTPPFSAENAVSARCDLNPKNGTYPFGALGHRSHGGTDMKMTTSKMASKLHFLAVNGPTYDQQPIFRWSEQDFANDTPHYGHPDAWKFPIIGHRWLW